MSVIPSLHNQDKLRMRAIVGFLAQEDQSDPAKHSNFLHRACSNKKVTLDAVKCLLETFPEAARVTMDSVYPIHMACCNESCPSSIIELLVKEKPCLVEQVFRCVSFKGLPLHCYLSRTSNIDLETVKMLVEAYPGALKMANDKFQSTPIHALLRNPDINKLIDIVQFIVETEPFALQMTDEYGRAPLHVACANKNIDLKTIQTLLDCWPVSITQQDPCERLPIHTLCSNHELDETASVNILAILIKASPGTVQHADKHFYLPIRLAAICKSPEFCELLVDAYPQSLSIEREHLNSLPVHDTCMYGSVDTVKYLLDLHPEHIDRSANSGMLPIHFATMGGKAETIKFLLMQDPAGAAKTMDDLSLPLHVACKIFVVDFNVVQLLFDSYPEAICTCNRLAEGTPLDIARLQGAARNSRVIRFLETQMTYARKAQDTGAMTTLDDNGWLPLHHALHDNATLGAIKLLAKGNSSPLRAADIMIPLRIACEFSSAGVVQFLVAELNDSCLNHCDVNNDSPLHYACRGGNCGVVKFLLERRVPSVSKRNCNNELPVHLLCESGDEKVDRESPEYVETIWHLLLAYPETVLNIDCSMPIL
mmetsp:Transcript_30711/g.64993  ORF Transcript_30711/g.64993 Transcript_30711/m.64993 type:complete len:594 (+) Transcript_30711:80-1861(+)